VQVDGDGNFDGLSTMGFDVLHTFDECSADSVQWLEMEV
jgi:beta-N-acetylhexosaminidase